MFLVPVSSDAPLRHFPWATVSLIGINSLLYLASATGILPPVDELAADYALLYGDGLHPLQWITSNFLHAGWLHLIGNMMFLWVVGLIVEGMLGWRMYVAAYVGLGIVECLIEQLCLPGPGASLGASAVIFGLLAMAMIWVPKNEIEFAYGVILPLMLHFGTFEISVLWVGVMMLAVQAGLAALFEFTIGSELFHLLGTALGFGLGVSMLRAGLVDCQGWDLFNVMRGTIGGENSASNRLRRSSPETPVLGDGRDTAHDQLSGDEEQQKRVGKKVRALTKFRRLVEEGKAADAHALIQRAKHVMTDFALPKQDLLNLSALLYDSKKWGESITCYEEYIRRFPTEADRVRVLVADMLVTQQKRPSAALKLLRDVNAETLTASDRSAFECLMTDATQLIDSGVIELEGQSWT